MISGEAVWGAPAAILAPHAADAVQVSPLIPGAARLEDLAPASLKRIVLAAPAGAIERRHALALAVRALGPGGELVALAPKQRGGLRLRQELQAFGLAPSETARRHQRICRALRPAQVAGLEEAIAAGGPQQLAGLGLWTQPGVFSWDRLDPGTAALIEAGLDLPGRGADLGCGLGVLALEVLKARAVDELFLIDIDRRAVEAARRNVLDPRAHIIQADVRAAADMPADLDFVVMNPPFHFAAEQDAGLGEAFIVAAARVLRRGGVLRMVANQTLPYEAALETHFGRVTLVKRAGGYKLHEATR